MPFFLHVAHDAHNFTQTPLLNFTLIHYILFFHACLRFKLSGIKTTDGTQNEKLVAAFTVHRLSFRLSTCTTILHINYKHARESTSTALFTYAITSITSPDVKEGPLQGINSEISIFVAINDMHD